MYVGDRIIWAKYYKTNLRIKLKYSLMSSTLGF